MSAFYALLRALHGFKSKLEPQVTQQEGMSLGDMQDGFSGGDGQQSRQESVEVTGNRAGGNQPTSNNYYSCSIADFATDSLGHAMCRGHSCRKHICPSMTKWVASCSVMAYTAYPQHLICHALPRHLKCIPPTRAASVHVITKCSCHHKALQLIIVT